jgi:hypothetical protein
MRPAPPTHRRLQRSAAFLASFLGHGGRQLRFGPLPTSVATAILRKAPTFVHVIIGCDGVESSWRTTSTVIGGIVRWLSGGRTVYAEAYTMVTASVVATLAFSRSHWLPPKLAVTEAFVRSVPIGRRPGSRDTATRRRHSRTHPEPGVSGVAMHQIAAPCGECAGGSQAAGSRGSRRDRSCRPAWYRECPAELRVRHTSDVSLDRDTVAIAQRRVSVSGAGG